MSFLWSYLVVVLYLSVTSSVELGSRGNLENLHGDASSDVKKKDVLAPPIGSLALDNDIPQEDKQSNEAICKELCKKGEGGNACLCDWPPVKRDVLYALKNEHMDNPSSVINFPTIETDPICQILCEKGNDGHFCMC